MPTMARLYGDFRAALRPARQAARDVRGRWLARVAQQRWRWRRPQRPHVLDRELIVSLTSYPPRFATLHLTLKCLLTQRMRPDRVILWISHQDMEALPASARLLERHGLELRATEDLRSFKKIVPTLRGFPNAYIATADDDAFYADTWLQTLIDGFDPTARHIPCGRALRMALQPDGRPSPYRTWPRAVPGECSSLVFATGIGGALFAPGSLHRDTCERALFERLAPRSDDAWLYWMARRAGWNFRKVGRGHDISCWPGSQRVALQHDNVPHGNDAQILQLTRRYGPCWQTPRAPAALRAAPAIT